MSKSKNVMVPIVLFVYNRPWHARQTIEALQKNTLAKESELFIYSDGPKNEKAEAKVRQVRDYIKTIEGFQKVTIVEREKNFGLAANTTDGVTSIINNHGRVIVLEDDLITSPYFLTFMNEALDFYENEEKVMHISGYMFPIDTEGLPEAAFHRATCSWGWGTWKRAWSLFEYDVEKIMKSFTPQMIKSFNLNGYYNFWSQIVGNKKNLIKTWAIFWYATVFLNGGLTLYPITSMVRNIGMDSSGEHCGTSDQFDVQLTQKAVTQFATTIAEYQPLVIRLSEYYKKIKPSIWTKIFRNLKRLAK